MKDWRQTLLSQYANGPTLTAILACLDQDLEASGDLARFYDTIWNVLTATGYGLDVWGKIVNVSRQVNVVLPPACCGFQEAWNAADPLAGVLPFDVGVFNSGAPPVARNVTLDNDTYRTLVMTKAMVNITDCTAPSLNALLAYLFAGRGRCYALDTGQMTMQYVFEFDLTVTETAILTQSGVLPRPTGVLANIVEATPGAFFGFSEAGPGPDSPHFYAPFDQGVFYRGAIHAG
ncbi:hypothetical protein P3T23_009413 [Paraburkholderia sp. GAS448]|uniref:DUF2612 domain-containing protein n=1 Tax=Paraburkholderia sp. GAS448 TaxID=3035136 RepID=UPI003D1D58A0